MHINLALDLLYFFNFYFDAPFSPVENLEIGVHGEEVPIVVKRGGFG
jgi:hypothetical protein